MPLLAQAVRKLRAILNAAAASLQYIAYCLRDLFVCLGVLLIPTCLSTFASLVLFLPEQTREYYRLLIENLAEPKPDNYGAAIFDAVLPVVLLFGMAACISFSAVALLAERDRPSLCRTAIVRCIIKFSPVLFGTLPLLAAIAGLSASSRAIDLQTQRTSIEQIGKFGDQEFAGQLNKLFIWAGQSDQYFSVGLRVLSTATVVFFAISTVIVLLNQRAVGHQGEALWHIARRRLFAPPFPTLSRARALEQSIEAAWEATAIKSFQGAGGDALRKGVLASWNPSGIKPALFFNTTEVDSGRRRIIAPFGFEREFRTDAQFLPLTENYDIPVSAAAVASARFPWLTPAGWFWEGDEAATPPATSERAKVHIVDGGYFENSGVTTAVEIINRLQHRKKRCCPNARFHLIVLTSGIYANGSSDAFSEAIAPVAALLNSRTARTYSTVELATRDLGAVEPDAKGALGQINKLQKVDFAEYVIPLPLVWRLSKVSAAEIFFLTGRVGHCVPDKHFEQTSKIKGFGTADCVQRLILHQLRGDDLDTALEDAQARHPQGP